MIHYYNMHDPNNTEYISVSEFVTTLYGITDKNRAPGDIPSIAYSERWLEAQDISGTDNNIKRSDTARILHLFIREKLQLKDLPDISGAEVLKDLYDCRICANHIAQVYLRGIMKPITIQSSPDRDFLIFDSKAYLTKNDAERILSALERFFDF